MHISHAYAYALANSAVNLPKRGDISVITCACAHVVEFTNVRGTNHRVPRAQDNSAVNLKFQNSANVVTSRHVATNVQDNSPVNFLCT